MINRLRCFAGLAWDAAEALLYSLNTNRVADVLWASARTGAAHRLVEKEAQEEVAEPRWETYTGVTYHGPLFFVPEDPAGGEAPNPPADAPPSQTFPTAGQPTSLGYFELVDAAQAVRGYANFPELQPNDAWLQLADRLESAARAIREEEANGR